MNENKSKPEVQGVEGLVTAYKNAVQKVKFSGPRNFKKVIEKVSADISK